MASPGGVHAGRALLLGDTGASCLVLAAAPPRVRAIADRALEGEFAQDRPPLAVGPRQAVHPLTMPRTLALPAVRNDWRRAWTALLEEHGACAPEPTGNAAGGIHALGQSGDLSLEPPVCRPAKT